jgi:predicted RNase H-like nuclease
VLVAGFPEAACVGVDMPIGLPEAGERTADTEARAFVGARRSSVFMTPPAAMLAADSYAAANVLAVQRSEKGISQQAWGLRENIGRVAAVAAVDPRLIEVHPEVSFAALAGGHMRAAKTTWNGQMDRRAALARAGVVLPDDLGEAGVVPVADVLDAAAVAWSARRFAAGEARSFPAAASPGDRQVIWY